MKDIFAAMSKDGRIARVTITDDDAMKALAHIDVTPEQLSTLIKSMAQVRAAMAEKFAMPDPGGVVFSDVTRKARFIIGREHVTAKEVYAAFLHEGYGWLCFTMEEKPAAAFVLMMSQNIATMKPGIVAPPKGVIV